MICCVFKQGFAYKTKKQKENIFFKKQKHSIQIRQKIKRLKKRTRNFLALKEKTKDL